MNNVQKAVIGNLPKRQLNSLRALQAKVETGSYMGVRVSPAQFAAMQAAFDIAKSTGEPLPPEALKAAALLGFK